METESSGSFRDVLAVLFRRKRTILLLSFTFEAALLIGNGLVPVSYEATSKLLIQRARSEFVLTPAEDRSASLLVSQPQDVNAEADIIKSRALFERAALRIGPERLQNGVLPGMGSALTEPRMLVSSFKLNGYFRFLQPPNANGHALSTLERAILDLTDTVKVVPLQASNIILVRYRHAVPTVAADTVNEVVKAYLDISLNLKQRTGAYNVFAEQARQAEGRLSELEDGLKAFDGVAGILSPQTQREVAVARLADLETTARTVRAEVAQARARVAALQRELGATPPRVQTVEEHRWNEAVDDLKKRLVELEVERVKLLARYTERHRSVIEKEEQIETVRAWLRREAEHVVGSRRTEINPVNQTLERDITEVRGTLEGLRAKEQVLAAELDSFRRQLTQLHARGIARDRLIREIKAIEDLYFLYKRKTEEARIDAVLDQSRITNVKVAEWATPPLEPAGVNRGFLLVLGSTVGLAGAVAVAFVRESLDRSIWSPRDVKRHLGLPVLASIPRTEA